MLQRILKKDMRRRKSVNIILFLFITLASIFLSSSMNNILVVFSAVDYYMDYANLPDITFIATGTTEREKIREWIEEEAPGVEEYDNNIIVTLNEKGMFVGEEGEEVPYITEGVSVYLGTMDAAYCKVFGEDGREFTLEPGQVAVTQASVQRNGIKPGDRLTIDKGGVYKEFTVKLATKDMAFGNDMTGMDRLMVCPEDYALFAENEKSELLSMYYVDTENEKDFIREMNNQGFATQMNTVTRGTYSMVYSFDMIMAALLILIGICLILIALLVLRFTLVFTIEEEYREIGIMKAVGLRDFSIKKIYLIKYLFLVTAGALLGLAASVPVSRAMVDGVSKNMVMEDTSANLWVNVICTLAIILIVLLFCYGCTRKLNRMSAIAAIRGGQTGERFGQHSGIRLHRRKRMPVVVFLGLNDMLSHVKRYLVLMITFSISFILITIPLNTLNTMQSKEMADKFCMDPDSAVYLKKIEAAGETAYKDIKTLKRGMERIERELAQIGYDAELTAVPIYFLRYGNEAGSGNIMTVQIVGENNKFLTYQEGEAPVLPNEIAFSKKIMEDNGWSIGDSVETKINGETQHLVITGTYADYMQIGSSARLNPALDCSGEVMFNYWNIMVDMETDKTQSELAEEFNVRLPDYEWVDAQYLIDTNVGGIQESLQEMLLPMTGMLCAVIMLITFLMERLFIVREKGEIAMMKSIGYKNRVIRIWQTLRMVWVAVISMIAAIPISLLTNQWILKPVFAIMGAEVRIQVVPWQVYGLYPGVLLLGIVAAALLATVNVKKINIRELNNLE